MLADVGAAAVGAVLDGIDLNGVVRNLKLSLEHILRRGEGALVIIRDQMDRKRDLAGGDGPHVEVVKIDDAGDQTEALGDRLRVDAAGAGLHKDVHEVADDALRHVHRDEGEQNAAGGVSEVVPAVLANVSALCFLDHHVHKNTGADDTGGLHRVAECVQHGGVDGEAGVRGVEPAALLLLAVAVAVAVVVVIVIVAVAVAIHLVRVSVIVIMTVVVMAVAMISVVVAAVAVALRAKVAVAMGPAELEDTGAAKVDKKAEGTNNDEHLAVDALAEVRVRGVGGVRGTVVHDNGAVERLNGDAANKSPNRKNAEHSTYHLRAVPAKAVRVVARAGRGLEGNDGEGVGKNICEKMRGVGQEGQRVGNITTNALNNHKNEAKDERARERGELAAAAALVGLGGRGVDAIGRGAAGVAARPNGDLSRREGALAFAGAAGVDGGVSTLLSADNEAGLLRGHVASTTELANDKCR